MTKSTHIKQQVGAIVEATGVPVHRVVATGGDHARPWASVHSAGTRRKAASEGAKSAALEETMVIHVRIKADSIADAETERDRLSDLIEHALRTMRPEAYDDKLYSVPSYTVTYEGSSDVWESGQGLADFIITASVTYQSTIKL